MTGKPIPQKRLLSTARGRKGERRIGTDPTLKVLRQLLFRMPLCPPSWPLLQLPLSLLDSHRQCRLEISLQYDILVYPVPSLPLSGPGL